MFVGPEGEILEWGLSLCCKFTKKKHRRKSRSFFMDKLTRKVQLTLILPLSVTVILKIQIQMRERTLTI